MIRNLITIGEAIGFALRTSSNQQRYQQRKQGYKAINSHKLHKQNLRRKEEKVATRTDFPSAGPERLQVPELLVPA